MRAGNAAKGACWVAALGLNLRHTAGTWQLARTLIWLHAGRHGEPAMEDRRPPPVDVVIPVLREQHHVAAALAWWKPLVTAFPGLSVTIVSTDREERERDRLALAVCAGSHITHGALPQLSPDEATDLEQARIEAGGRLPHEVATKILSRTPLTSEVVAELMTGESSGRIHHVTYPGAGRKAGQVNHAARALPPGGYVAVYDVDSRPDAELLNATYKLLAADHPVVQQHALHIALRREHDCGVKGLVQGSATLQSIWTLRREIPYARRYHARAQRSGARGRVWAGLSQPVGHGLFLRRDIVEEIGGFPETTVLDDVPAGVPLSLRGIPVVTLPHLTVVPAPESVTEVVAQGRRWFCSYLDYPAVLRDMAHAGTGSPSERGLLRIIAAYRGLAWLVAGPLTAVTLATALCPRSGSHLRATASAGILLATVVPVVMSARVRPGPHSARAIGRDAAELLAAYLLRSLGPWLAVADAVRGRHPNSVSFPAPKTHRRPGGAS
ncbi:glycosyltransferase [Streptomyces sp. SID3343]|uniref:glycosyltransferase family 2 protein n=1 Tax=Streptomyces sp. SID3343 TaxID=2690260 RepID=UPI0013696ED0|nr:glycosyltransferase [Streptomyces sp. SID3343]MYW02321.1 glycosyltransferase [Streptomyces sp. SID3343]